MAHSIELLFDAASEATITGIWHNLAAAGLPSQLSVGSGTNRPHVTLIAAQHISAAVDAALRTLARELPLFCVVGAPVVFTRRTLARRCTAVDIGAAFALEDAALGSDLPARLVGLRRWDGDNRVDHLLVDGAD